MTPKALVLRAVDKLGDMLMEFDWDGYCPYPFTVIEHELIRDFSTVAWNLAHKAMKEAIEEEREYEKIQGR